MLPSRGLFTQQRIALSESKELATGELRHLVQHHLEVLPREHLRTVANHLLRPGELRVVREALHKEEKPSESKRFPALAERAALLAGLDDDGRVGEERHGAIANRKVLWLYRLARCKLRDDELLAHETLLKRAVLRRIRLIERRSDDGDRMPPLLECCLMRRRVDAFGEATDDDNAARDEGFCESTRPLQSFRGRLSRPDNRDARAVSKERHVASDEKTRRGVLCLDLVKRSEDVFERVTGGVHLHPTNPLVVRRTASSAVPSADGLRVAPSLAPSLSSPLSLLRPSSHAPALSGPRSSSASPAVHLDSRSCPSRSLAKKLLVRDASDAWQQLARVHAVLLQGDVLEALTLADEAEVPSVRPPSKVVALRPNVSDIHQGKDFRSRLEDILADSTLESARKWDDELDMRFWAGQYREAIEELSIAVPTVFDRGLENEPTGRIVRAIVASKHPHFQAHCARPAFFQRPNVGFIELHQASTFLTKSDELHPHVVLACSVLRRLGGRSAFDARDYALATTCWEQALTMVHEVRTQGDAQFQAFALSEAYISSSELVLLGLRLPRGQRPSDYLDELARLTAPVDKPLFGAVSAGEFEIRIEYKTMLRDEELGRKTRGRSWDHIVAAAQKHLRELPPWGFGTVEGNTAVDMALVYSRADPGSDQAALLAIRTVAKLLRRGDLEQAVRLTSELSYPR